MTIPVFVSGVHIDDDGNLVIDADKAAAAGVSKIDIIEGEAPAVDEEYSCGYSTVSGAFHKPGCSGECGIMNPGEAVKRRRIERRKAKAANRARITELESQVANWRDAHERAAVIAAEEADRQTEELRKQLAEAREMENANAGLADGLEALLVKERQRAEKAEARAADLAIAKKVADAAADWADAQKAYEAGAGGSSAYLRAREQLLLATVREYRAALNPNARQEGEKK